MRLAVAGGGTGGHIYPAVAIIEALQEQTPVEVLWLGVAGNPEEGIATGRGWHFASVPAAKVLGTGLRAPLGVAFSLFGGLTAARRLRAFGAAAVIATGGYASVPGVAGARLAGVPVFLFLPDVRAGLAVRFTRRLATRLATTSERGRQALGGGKVAVTGYPVRREFFTATREAARPRLGLGTRPVVLVFGASQGAASFNRAVLRWGADLLSTAQVLHVSGARNFDAVSAAAVQAGLTPEKGYHLYPYLENLPEAMAAADLVVSRGGASVLGELTAAGRPSVLVPYPHAGAHQKENARFLVDEGAAMLIDDAEIEERFGPTVHALLADPAALASMAERARALARPRAAADLADLVRDLAGGR
ncbi:MAG: UDP-N-acetylglucosamine--N-acetylmuramyl-(pentapeptide) pyrophosphoryl-undecaprenol N-acetylglucosamine transferase [Anaerolineae bacterium]